MHDLLLPPDVKELKGVLEIFKEQSHEIKNVPQVVFFEKAVLKILGELLENYLRQSANWKPITMRNMCSVAVFLGIFRKYPEQLF